MPTIFAANDSVVLVEGAPVEGVNALEYRRHRARSNVYALGSAERIGVVTGAETVEGRLRVASTAPAIDTLSPDQVFQVSAQLRHGETEVTVSFDDCYLTDKSFELGVGGTGEAVYTFTATRLRES